MNTRHALKCIDLCKLCPGPRIKETPPSLHHSVIYKCLINAGPYPDSPELSLLLIGCISAGPAVSGRADHWKYLRQGFEGEVFGYQEIASRDCATSTTKIYIRPQRIPNVLSATHQLLLSESTEGDL
ncbi:hypothetical protein NDU88_003679 [Pleurodeles waltl]|uniref:Uncharacterized protein n=1 Tax=Pleurodeles waltl TaxID=8319 RepID=A0AAV7M429_PLEWA|nr:hypothetical protein NDU88_003679 [Pleurodeles waltl]